MLKLLPFILIPILIIAGLGFWRYAQTRPASSNPQSTSSPVSDQTVTNQPVEVPKTLPAATLDDRVKSLEDTLSQLTPQVNSLKSSNSSANDAKITALEVAVADLKTKVAALEQAAPATQTSAKYPLYIPLGSGGGPWTDQSWNSLNEYQATINPDNYSGYTSMQLEGIIRLSEAAGTGSIRLYNVSDNSAITSAQVDTTATSFSLLSSGTFKLPSGQKTYTIQVQSTQGKTLFIQNARIKVNF